MQGPLNEVNQCPIKRVDDDRGEALSSDAKSCHFRIGCEAFSEDHPQQALHFCLANFCPEIGAFHSC